MQLNAKIKTVGIKYNLMQRFVYIIMHQKKYQKIL